MYIGVLPVNNEMLMGVMCLDRIGIETAVKGTIKKSRYVLISE